MIKVGSKVRCTDKIMHFITAGRQPMCGTVGVVEAVLSNGMYLVQWPEGKSIGDGKWVSREEWISEVTEDKTVVMRLTYEPVMYLNDVQVDTILRTLDNETMNKLDIHDNVFVFKVKYLGGIQRDVEKLEYMIKEVTERRKV